MIYYEKMNLCRIHFVNVNQQHSMSKINTIFQFEFFFDSHIMEFLKQDGLRF